MPPLPQTPRSGEYVERVPDGQQIAVSGAFRDGLRQGTWTHYFPDGQVRLVQNWDRGRLHGREQVWAENGQLVTDGYHARGNQVGEWTFWHDNGALSVRSTHNDQGQEHGPFVRYDAGGQLRVSGESFEGSRHGRWIWYDAEGRVTGEVGYFRGANHGPDIEFHPDGTLAFRGNSFGSRRHGMQERYDTEGQLVSRGEELWGYPVGEHVRDGKRETYVRGLPQKLAADDRKRDRVLAKVSGTRDHFKRHKFIVDVADYTYYGAYLVHLWRAGFELGDDHMTWDDFAKAAGLFSGEDVVTFLRQIETVPDDWNILPHWHRALDWLLLAVYPRDPQPIDEAFASLPEPIRKGVAFVRGRLGHDIGTVLRDELPWVVRRYVTAYDLSVNWPFVEAGSVVSDQKVVHADRTRGEIHDQFTALFGTPEEWRAETARVALDLASEGRLDIAKVREVVEGATPEEMVRLVNGAYSHRDAAPGIYRALVDWRADDAATTARIAREHLASEPEEGGWPVVAAAITAHRAAGTEPPQDLVDALHLVSDGTPTHGGEWYRNQLVNQLGYRQASLPAFRAAYLDLPIGVIAPRQAPLHAAMQALSPAHARSVVERTMALPDYRFREAAQYLYAVDDPGLWSRFLDRMAAEDQPFESLWYGIGDIGARVLPLLVEQLERRGMKRDWREGCSQAIIVALCRAVVDDGDFPEEYDRLFTFGEGLDGDDWKSYVVFAERVLWTLPADRVERIVVTGLASSSGAVFARAFRAIGYAPTPAVVELAMSELLRREKDLDAGQLDHVRDGLRSLDNFADWVRWIRRSGGGANLAEAFVSELGKEVYEKLDEELESEGAAVTEMDAADRLRVCAEGIGGRQRIYVLRNNVPDSGTYNVIGGAAPGVDASRWPLGEGGEPMTHLFTLDTGTMPELTLEMGADARTVSVFCLSPDDNDAFYPGNDCTAVVCSTEEQLASAGDPPAEVEQIDRDYFEAVAVDVDPAVWESDEGDEDEDEDDDEDDENNVEAGSDAALRGLRSMIYQASARVLGPEIWLQEGEGEDGFLMQFDESFCPMNLGDAGIMYVYRDTAFWQCH
jgi:antitoxin component YwqK of YwqJK toxin-antitoxin module